MAGLDDLFARLRACGAVTAADPAWCRRVYLALLHEAHDLPADSPMLADPAVDDRQRVEARIDLLVATTLAALSAGGQERRALIDVHSSQSSDQS